MQDMVGAVGWIVVGWVLLSLPLGIWIGAVLRHSALGLRAPTANAEVSAARGESLRLG